MKTTNQVETKRIELQKVVDRSSTHQQRNESGQHATPPDLANQILRYACELTSDEKTISFLDPAIGTGSFYSALLSSINPEKLHRAEGFEINESIVSASRDLWGHTGLKLHQQDFTSAPPPTSDNRFNLVICNPPYVRHHHIPPEQKKQLKNTLAAQGNMKLSGLAGLYAHFMGLTHSWMTDGALAAWLIPSEFMDVNYGEGIRNYLTTTVTLLHIHRFDPEASQFKDALVSSAIVWFKNIPPPRNHKVTMTFGGTLDHPQLEGIVPLETLRNDRKWSKHPETVPTVGAVGATLADFFHIKRGIATGHNSFFVMTDHEAAERGIPEWALKPVLPGARNLTQDIVLADDEGIPILDRRLFLLDSDLGEQDLATRSPSLSSYLQTGLGTVSETYLCSRKTPWYSQEKRPPAPFLCTYMGRIKKNAQAPPFRFILNHSEATALNVYLMMYPKGVLAAKLEEDPQLKTATWEALRSIGPQDVMREGRVYGGGLRKVEPKELGRVRADRLLDLY